MSFSSGVEGSSGTSEMGGCLRTLVSKGGKGALTGIIDTTMETNLVRRPSFGRLGSRFGMANSRSKCCGCVSRPFPRSRLRSVVPGGVDLWRAVRAL